MNQNVKAALVNSILILYLLDYCVALCDFLAGYYVFSTSCLTGTTAYPFLLLYMFYMQSTSQTTSLVVRLVPVRTAVKCSQFMLHQKIRY